MNRTVIGVFGSELDAEKAVNSLRRSGFRDNEISIVAKDTSGGRNGRGHHVNEHGEGFRGEGLNTTRGGGAINASSYYNRDFSAGGPVIAGDTGDTFRRGDDITDGALSGATWGGLAGLALGAGALAVPGVGPLLAAGPIAAALTGAATGGIAGGLIDWGIPEERGRHYENKVREGNVLAIVHVSDKKADNAAQVLREHGARDVEIHQE